MNFDSVLNNLKLYDIDYTVIGSHSLYLLNDRFNLDIDIDLTNKDLDLLVKDSSNFHEFIKIFEINRVNKKSKNIYLYKVFDNEGKNSDLITRINFRHMKIDDTFIPYIDYDTIKEYCYDGEIYGHAVRHINLEVYYGIIQSTGFKKYKPIIEQILQKYPDLKNRVLA